MRIIMIAGLPGSGKSFLGREIAAITHSNFIDDPTSLREIEDAVKKKKDLVIADYSMCVKRNRLQATSFLNKLDPNIFIKFIFFDNDPDACRQNIQQRQSLGDNRQVEQTIRMFSKLYDSGDEKVIPVWRKDYEYDIRRILEEA